MRYKRTSVKPGPDQRIYLHVVSSNLGVPRVDCGSAECGVRSAECGVRNGQMRSVIYMEWEKRDV